MRAGMAGLAALYWPQTMGKGLAANPAVEFRAAATLGVADETISALLGRTPQAYAEQFGLKLYSDAGEMIAAEGLDTVVLITPHSRHADWVEQLAPLGVNIFIPKSFTTTLADAQRIVDAQAKYGVRIAAGPTARYLPFFMAVKNALAAGAIGQPFSLRLCHHHGTLDVFNAADWYRDAAEGGPELSLGWYGIDLILHLLDDQVTQIYASYGNFTSPDSPFMDCGRMVLQMAQGGTAVFDMLFCNHFQYPSWQLEIVGSEGIIAIQRSAPDSNGAVVTLHNRAGTQTLPLPQETPGWEYFWIDEFLTGRPLTLDAAGAREITRLSLAARDSAQARQAVQTGSSIEGVTAYTMIDPMLDTPTYTRKTAPTRIALGDGLLLRSVESQEDADRYATFNSDYVGAVQGLTCEKLLAHHPTMHWDDFFFVEDERTGAVVSCICLIPWQARFGAVELRVAMLEMVVTHPDYRHRGLVRKQIEHFQRAVAEQGFDLCIIEGIPYYYRQYGYAYATDHWASDGLAVAQVPDGDGDASIRLRAATLADVPALDHFYRQAMSQLTGWTLRSHEYWRYLLEAAHFPVVMVENAAREAKPDTPLGDVAGYVVAWRNNAGVQVAESGLPEAATALAFLQWCKNHVGGEVILGWPTTNTLVQVARSLGSSVRPADQWLLRVPDLPKLLQKMAPLLAARLAASSYAGLNAELTLNLFRQAYLLSFVRGELVGVEPLGFVDASMGADGGDLCIPPDAFVRLLLGYRTLDELADAWPDMVVRPARRHLWQVLWPKQSVYFWLPYMAYGANTRILSDEFSQPA